MEEEVAILRHKLMNLNEVEVTHAGFYRGQLDDKNVVLIQSGIRKVNAAISTTLLTERFRPTLIINTGSVGTLDGSSSVGDTLTSNHVIYHDAGVIIFRYDIG